MKKLMMLGLASVFVGSFAFAADNENSATTDHSHNPVTGTDTDTTKVKKKMTGADGAVKEKKMKKTVKHKTNGKTETSESKDTSSTPAE